MMSDRIYIQSHKEQDLLNYHKLMSDKESMFFLPDLLCNTIEESKKSLAIAINEASFGEKRMKYFWGIFLKDGTYLGEIGYTVVSIDHLNNKCVNLGYFIYKDYWNKGYVSEAVKEVLHFAFNIDNVVKIETGCLIDNVYSERIMIKLGFNKESHKKKSRWLNGKWIDRVEYGFTKEQYLFITNE